MALHGTLMEALLTWVNSLKVDEPIERLSQMQDLNILIKIVTKLNGNSEETPQILTQPLEERLKFLQRHCRCGSKAEDVVQWENILHGESSDLEICKVIVLLFYVSNMKCKNAQEWECFDHKTQTELASILRFVLDNEDDLTLDDKLIRFLQRKARVPPSSDSASSSDETISSPNLPVRKSQVRFLELHRVASSSTMKSLALDSPSSPMSEVLHMPQFQIRRLRKQLIEGRDLRDELELELSETRKRLAEKDAQIFLMQQRIERLVVLNEKQDDQQEPKELEELREKNESLMIRLRDALKQCQDMKTDRNQLERKNDQLTEANGDLTYKMRDLSNRLAQLQNALNDITDEHELSMTDWRQQHSQLENELNVAVTEKKCLEEHNLILGGKISILEDQLKMMDSGSQEKGESMGDVLKLERLQQEVAEMNTKAMELQVQIAQMEEEKSAAKAAAESQRSRLESEKIQLQDIVTNLQTSLSEITFQKERQDQEARLQEERLTHQITTLKLEISKLKQALALKDKELSGLHKEVEEERRQKGQLVEDLQRHEESSKKTIDELNHQMNHLGSTLKQREGKLQELNEKLSTGDQQVANLQLERDKLVGERDSTVTMFNEYKNSKEEQLSTLEKTWQTLQKDHQAGLAAVEELKREKAQLALKVQELDATILDLIAKCQNLDMENDSQSKSQAATLEFLRTQITEQEAQLKIYEKDMSEMEKVSEENGQMKEHLLSLEETVKNLKELLEQEKRNSASLESDRQRKSVLEGDLKTLSESSQQALAELDKERAASKKLESQLRQLEEELRAKTETLQKKLSETSTAIRQREEAIETVTKEMGKWKERAQSSSQAKEHLEKLKKEHNEVCQQLEKERSNVSEIEAQAKVDTAAQLNRVSQLESALSATKAQLEEKEAQGQKLLNTIRSTEEKLKVAQQEEAKRISQLETSCSNTVQDLKLLSKELSEEKLRKAEVEAALKQLEEQKSERISTLESEMSAMQVTAKEREGELKKLHAEVELLRKQQEESTRRHQQELTHKDGEVCRLAKEKESAVTELKMEQAYKMEVEAQLQKSMDVHKSEFSALQNELSRSLNLITVKESEVERLDKEIAAREEEFQQVKQTAGKLSEEVVTLRPLKERAAAQEEEIKRYIHTAKATDSEMAGLKATICEKEKAVQRLAQDIQCKITENTSIQEQYQATVGDVKVLQAKIAELEKRCKEEEEAICSARKEVANAKTAASEMASASEQHQRGIQALSAEIEQEQQKTSDLMKQLEESRSLQSERESSLEALKKELFHKVQELEQSQKSFSESSRELSWAVSASQEQEKSLADSKEQVAQYQQEIETKNGQMDSMQEEVKKLTAKLAANECGFAEVKELLESEKTRSVGWESQLKVVQEKLEASTKELVEKQGVVQSLRTEASSYKEDAGKHRASAEGLQKKLSSQEESIAKLEQDLRVWQEKCSQREEQMSGVQQQLSKSQSLLEELASLQSSQKEMKTEQDRRESQHKEELLKNQKRAESLQAELEETKAEVASLVPLKESLSQKESMLEALQKETTDHVALISLLQEEKKQLVGENKSLSQASDQGAKKMETELSKVSELHKQELQSLRVQYEKMVSAGKEQLDELSQKLETVTSNYDNAKTRVKDERQTFQEEKQKLLAQVEQLEGAKKDQSEQVKELNKQLSQQEKTIQSQQEKLKKRDSAAHEEVEKKQKRVSELETQLEQQVQAVEHYKAQIEKAKLHYDAKKQQNQQLSDELQNITKEQDQLRNEHAELKVESERVNKELQLSLLQIKETEQSCKTLTSQVRSLEAQVEFADRQLRDLGKFQVETDSLKSRETLCPPRVTRSHADVSIDSLDMSSDDDHPMNSTRKNGRSHQDPSTSAQSGSPEGPATRRLPRKVESLESLYFTPIPNRVQSKLDTSLGSIGDLSLDSSKKTRSARRRTTQVINITMTKKTKEEVEPESANTSFYSLRSAPSQQSLHQQHTRRGGRPQPAISAPAITSLPSQESLVKSEHTSSDDSLNNSVLMNLPGYRPATRSSARLSQTGSRSSFYMSTCQDEPDPQEDWNRIAELQQRNRACPPHLKTCYPVESRPSIVTSNITDEEVKTGDPRETLRRATLMPAQIQESLASTRRMTLAPTSIEHSSGITTRQQMKRVSEESHYGPDTPESKKSASCFPRPMTPRDKPETRKMSTAESKDSINQKTNSSRRQTMSFSVLNTPKKLGSSLLKRGLNKKSTPKNTPQGRGASGSTGHSPHLSSRKSPSRRSPRGSTAKSPKMTSKFFERKQTRNK